MTAYGAYTSPARTSVRAGTDTERGVVLIWAILCLVMVAAIIFAGNTEYRALDELSQAEFAAGGQAHAVAEAGVIDSFAWLRRQSTQPVTVFAPQLDLTAEPEINETEDPSVGLVRTFEIAPGLWARYSVVRGEPPEPFTDANANGVFDPGEAFDDTNGDGRRTPGTGTRDVSSERGLPAAGTVWLVESLGRIYRRSNNGLPLGVGVNVQIASARMATEVRRMTIIPPAAAAVCNRRGDDVVVGARGRIRGGTAIAYAPSTGAPDIAAGVVPGNTAAIPSYADDVEDVFGVDWPLLRSMADISTTDPAHGVPVPIPDFALVVVTGDVAFTAARPLRGTGIVIVKGNCSLESGSNSFFNGVLYVDGHLTARAPTYLRGTVIVTGASDIRGSGGDYCEIEHDATTLGLLQVKMGQYRYTKSRYVPAPKTADGRPDESITITGSLDGIPKPPAGGGATTGGATTFQTDLMIDEITAYLAAHPLLSVREQQKLKQAQMKLEMARLLLMSSPPDDLASIAKIGEALAKLVQGTDAGLDLASLLPSLSGGDGKLMNDIAALVDRRINESAADPVRVAEARAIQAQALAAQAQADVAQAEGNTLVALQRYETAAATLLAALEQLHLP